jgi:hypothetical protein
MNWRRTIAISASSGARSPNPYCLPDVSAVSPVKREHDVCEMKVMNVTDEESFSNERTFERVAYSSEIYPIEYIPNFHELEYAIPVENGKEALRQVRELMLTRHTDCIYPVEYRFVAGDAGMLSPYYRRSSVTVSVSGGPGIDYWAYLLDVDAILRHMERGRIGVSSISTRPKTCPCSIRAFTISRRSAAGWTPPAGS